MQQPTTIVFTDFDGVIFTERSIYAAKDFRPYQVSQQVKEHVPDPLAIRFLNDVFNNDNMALALITSWRSNAESAIDVLQRCGFTGGIHPEWKLPGIGSDGMEIDKFLADHPEVTKYIILTDDLKLLHPHHLPFTVPCDGINGISHQNMEQARHLLHGAPLDPFLETRWQYFERRFPNDPFVMQLKQTYIERYGDDDSVRPSLRPAAPSSSAGDPPTL